MYPCITSLIFVIEMQSYNLSDEVLKGQVLLMVMFYKRPSVMVLLFVYMCRQPGSSRRFQTSYNMYLCVQLAWQLTSLNVNTTLLN